MKYKNLLYMSASIKESKLQTYVSDKNETLDCFHFSSSASPIKVVIFLNDYVVATLFSNSDNKQCEYGHKIETFVGDKLTISVKNLDMQPADIYASFRVI